jgi:hypothetical protein
MLLGVARLSMHSSTKLRWQSQRPHIDRCALLTQTQRCFSACQRCLTYHATMLTAAKQERAVLPMHSRSSAKRTSAQAETTSTSCCICNTAQVMYFYSLLSGRSILPGRFYVRIRAKTNPMVYS